MEQQPTQQQQQQQQLVFQQLLSDRYLRGWEGEGSQGTQLLPTVAWFRSLACITQALSAVYMLWRAARSCPGGWLYFYSLPVLLAEAAMALLSNLFLLSLWRQVERPQRWLEDMLPLEDFPAVDVYIVCYTEPVSVVEPTCIAALNLNWPGSRLVVHVLDDGNSSEIADIVERLQFQARYMQRDAQIVHVARQKVRGVPHHAKAGNINSALLKEGPGSGEFILVLDCDMIVHPDFLMRTLGHFYWQPDAAAGLSGSSRPHCPENFSKTSSSNCCGKQDHGVAAPPSAAGPMQRPWVLKEKAAFIQTPQDFWNVSADDPLVHFARFFYGPMLQGRDGIGAAPCCGTGVVFRRDVLVSVGGQAYGSITEDYNTAMTLLASGFSTMFLNERMAFGQAPGDLSGMFAQRLRWAMGTVQILLSDNPLTRPGLTLVQALLFWEAAVHHFLSLPTVLLSLLPLIYMFTEVAPVSALHLWEFSALFCSYYLANRLMMWQLHRAVEGGDQEMWRGSQMWVWLAPNHCKAIWKVLLAELPLLQWLTKKEIAFKVTQKAPSMPAGTQSSPSSSKPAASVSAWRHNALYLTYYAATAAALAWVLVHAVLGVYTLWQGALLAAAFGWALLLCLCVWPPVSTLLPREETEEGWRIQWDVFLKIPEPIRRAASSTAALLTPRSHGHHSRRQSAYGSYANTPSAAGPALSPLSRLGSLVGGIWPPSSFANTPSDAAAAAGPALSPLSHLGSLVGGMWPSSSHASTPSDAAAAAGPALSPLSRLGSLVGGMWPPSSHASTPAAAADAAAGPALSPLSRLGSLVGGMWPPGTHHSPHSGHESPGAHHHHAEPAIGRANGLLLPLTGNLAVDAALPVLTQDAAIQAGLSHASVSSSTGTASSALCNHQLLGRSSSVDPGWQPSSKYTEWRVRALPEWLAANSSTNAAAGTSPHLAGHSYPQVAPLKIPFSKSSSTARQSSPGTVSTAMLVPTEPANIFEASIAARPNFEARQLPPGSYWYQIVNALILCVLLAGTVIELVTGKAL
ncbi:hypothetical protein OEZ86_004623 [Tetradesmus obliquus]|nr:hypothetical protein OEZ86_004623 [Tetradesmus obliquus]